MKHDVYHYKLPKLGIIAFTSLKYKELTVSSPEKNKKDEKNNYIFIIYFIDACNN